MKKTTFWVICFLTLLFLSGCDTMGTANNFSPTTTLNNPELWKKSTNTTWQALQHTPLPALQKALGTYEDPIAKGWLSLAIISKQYSTDTAQLIKELQTWQQNYPPHPGNALIPDDETLEPLRSQSPPQHIALLLPLTGKMATSGQIVRNGFVSAYYASLGNTPQKQVVSFYDTNATTDLAALYQKAVTAGADIIIGPLTKPEVESLSQLNHFEVPVLTLNYTSSSFFKTLPAHFYEFGLSPTAEAQQIALKARQAGLSKALVIASADAWGHRVADALSAQWQSSGGKMVESFYFTGQSDLTRDIANLLHVNPQEDQVLSRNGTNKATLAEQRRQDIDVIFIFAQPDLGRQIIPLLRFYYAGNIPFYSISAIYSGRPNPAKDKDLDGVTFTEIPWLIQLAENPAATPEQFERLYAVGRDAYLLSQTLPRLTALPAFPMYGATGALEIDHQQIHQRLPVIKMHDGHI